MDIKYIKSITFTSAILTGLRSARETIIEGLQEVVDFINPHINLEIIDFESFVENKTEE